MHFDIFCRVIDNFGDIGVCWRLTRQLADLSPLHRVTLWVDDLKRFQRIEKRVKLQDEQQLTPTISVIHWKDGCLAREPGDVVIEAFNCDLPQSFINAMAARQSLWINLEYLSAEPWVEGCHGLPSLQSNGLKKFFFFPGFTPATGGLLREDGLLDYRHRWQSQPALRWALLEGLGLPEDYLQGLRNGWRQAFLFGYPNAPVSALTNALSSANTPWLLLVPQGTYASITALASGNLRIAEIPFVNQPDFDHLLWSSDLNFVRGEDSLVRALWAGKPLVWQIYEQEDQAHLTKLQAWLGQSTYPHTVHDLMMAWNTQDKAAVSNTLSTLLNTQQWQTWQAAASQWATALADPPSLAQSLEAFCAKNR